jgi:hypothetical protein
MCGHKKGVTHGWYQAQHLQTASDPDQKLCGTKDLRGQYEVLEDGRCVLAWEQVRSDNSHPGAGSTRYPDTRVHADGVGRRHGEADYSAAEGAGSAQYRGHDQDVCRRS